MKMGQSETEAPVIAEMRNSACWLIREQPGMQRAHLHHPASTTPPLLLLGLLSPPLLYSSLFSWKTAWISTQPGFCLVDFQEQSPVAFLKEEIPLLKWWCVPLADMRMRSADVYTDHLVRTGVSLYNMASLLQGGGMRGWIGSSPLEDLQITGAK